MPNEDLPTQVAIPPRGESTFADVQLWYDGHPEPNPHMVNHLARLAGVEANADQEQDHTQASPESLTGLQQRIRAAEAVLADYWAGDPSEQRWFSGQSPESRERIDTLVDTYRDLYYNDAHRYDYDEEGSDSLTALLELEANSPQDLDDFFGIVRKMQKTIEVDNLPFYSVGLPQAVHRIPADKLRALYSDALHTNFRDMVYESALMDNGGVAEVVTHTLTKYIYNKKLVELSRDPVALQDPAVLLVVTRNDAPWGMVEEMEFNKAPEEPDQEYNLRLRRDTSHALDAMGLPKTLVRQFEKNMELRTRRSRMEQGQYIIEDMIDGGQLYLALENATSNLMEVGRDNIKAAYEQCGLTNLDYFNPSAFNRMGRYARGDKDLLDHLKAGDVTVVFSDGRSDYNGANSKNNEIYETEHDRTLFFEINRPSDFYRYMIGLQKRGIAPSIIVLSSHAEGGVMDYGIGQVDGFSLETSEVPLNDVEDSTVIDLKQAKGLQRVVQEYMQPIRGMDAPESQIGRKIIVLEGCSIGEAVITGHELVKPEHYIEDLPDWMREVQQQPIIESMDETVVKLADDDRLDVYASPEAMSTQRVPGGVAFNFMSDKGKWSRGYSQRYRLQEDKTARRTEHVVVPLRKDD